MTTNNNDNNNGNGWTVLRILQVLTLTVVWGILAYFLDVYNNSNARTPDGITLLFVAALLGGIWTFATLIHYLRAKEIPWWIIFWDVVFFALLIAGVIMLGNVTETNCIAYYGEWRETSWYSSTTTTTTTTGDPSDPATKIILGTNGDTFDTQTNTQVNNTAATYNKPCSLLKAAFGLAIANIVFFFFTVLLGIGLWRETRERRGRRTIVKEEIIETGGYPGGNTSRTVIEEQKVYERPITPPSVYLGPTAGAPGSVYDDPSASQIGYERERRRSKSEYAGSRTGRTHRSHRRSGSRRHSRTYVDDDFTGSRRSVSGRRQDREGPRSSVGYVRGV